MMALLHSMSQTKGHFQICKLIIDNVEDKNPANDNGKTPLYTAAFNGHLDV